MKKQGRGRPQSIPERHFVTLFALQQQGLGVRRIATRLNELGIQTSRGSVERALKRQGCYSEGRS